MALYPNAVTGGRMSMKDLERRQQNAEQEIEGKESESETETPNTDETNVTHETSEDNAKKDTNWEKRYRDLQSYTAKQINELTAKMAEVEKQAKAKPLLSDADVKLAEEIRNEHSDTYTMVTAIVRKEFSDKFKELEDENVNLRTQLGEVQAVNTKSAWLKEIQKKHPDVLELETDPTFVAWFEEQPLKVQEFARSPIADDVIYLLNMYKKELGIGQKDTKAKQKALAAAPVERAISEPPVTSGKKIWTLSEIKALTKNPTEYAKVQQEIMAAQRENRININA